MSVSQNSYSRIKKALIKASEIDGIIYTSISKLESNSWELSFLPEIISEIYEYYTEYGVCIDPELAENDIKILRDIEFDIPFIEYKD